MFDVMRKGPFIAKTVRDSDAPGCSVRLSRRSSIGTVLAATLLGLSSATADDLESIDLTTGCEVALAKSALPDRLREQASAYVWEEGAYRLVDGSGNSFHCLVSRNHPSSIIPMCVTASGTDSILPGIIYKATLSMAGKSPSEVNASFAKKAERGEFVAPPAPGITYMMSPYNHIYQEEKSGFWNVPAHVMIFAPGATNESVGGATFQEAIQNPGVPIVVDPGIHGYMVTFVKSSSATAEVEQACAGERFLTAAGE